uniref:Uncharacterized protein n=1 Tax=Siphoviridae sp. ctquf9 TaxID=2826470 RepID=A0A8S5M487_9CAUD|nr:MAG TPA: hypothetical protein [Siphoviridae sp. ctquf9]
MTNSRIQFPRFDILAILSSHVETIVLLSHKSPDSHIDVKVEFG